MHSLPLFHRLAGQVVIVLGDGDAADAKRRLLTRAGAVTSSDPATAAARLAFIAMPAPEAAAAMLKARGLLVNVADRPDLCDFTLPSVLDRDPVLIAVGTGGASAGLAKAVRLRLEAMLPSSLGALATALEQARGLLRRRWPDPAERRMAIDAALAPGGILDPLSDGAAGRVDQWIGQGAAAGPDTGQIVTITLASDDADDLTLRQARWLGQADVIVHDAAVSPAILARARADAARRVIGPAGPEPASGPGLTVILRRG